MQTSAPSAFLENLEYTINHCGRYQCEDQWRLEMRTIPDYDLFYIVNGKGRIRIDRKWYEAEKGDLFIFKPGIRHGGEHFPPENFEIWALHFSARFYRVWNFHEILHLPDKISLPDTSVIPDYLHRAITESISHELGGHAAARHGLGLLFVELLRLMSSRDELSARLSRFYASSRIISVIEYIMQNLPEKLDLHRMAGDLGLSTSLLHKTCKKTTTHSPMNLVNRIKINAAMHYLKDREISISRVSEMVGFEDEAYFSRTFRKWAGTAPKKYQLSLSERLI